MPAKERFDPLELVDRGLGLEPAVTLAFVLVQFDRASECLERFAIARGLCDGDDLVGVALQE